jgi:hypothetical protein
MSTFGVDNFIGEVSVDGSVANYKFSDPDDLKNVMEVSVSEKEFPAGVKSADSREVSDYAYSLVAEKMNAVRSDRIRAQETKLLSDNLEADKEAKAVSSHHLETAQDSQVKPAGTEKREDGATQTVYNVQPATDKKK